MKILLAGILGGIAMFIWTSIAHMALPLGEAGIREIPNEHSTLAPLQRTIGDQSGLYLFPGLGLGQNATRAQRKEAMQHMVEKYASSPSGLLVYHAPGRPLTFGKLLAVEFATELLAAVLAVWLLAQTQLVTFGSRVGFILVVGTVAAIATNISYSNWAQSTQQFIPHLLEAAAVAQGMSVLDVGAGPGYVAAAAKARGAVPIGLDFSKQMVSIAKKIFPSIEFREGDAQNLPFADGSFDRVLANFALLHLPDPGRACTEACRVLKRGGRFGFTVWAEAAENPYAQVIDDAIQAHADLDVKLPSGPPYYLYKTKEEFRQAMERAGFDATSMTHAIHRI